MDLYALRKIFKYIYRIYYICQIFGLAVADQNILSQNNSLIVDTSKSTKVQTKIQQRSKYDGIEDTFKLLQEGEEYIQLGYDRHIVLVLGNTGSGKSTLTQFIAGDNTKLISLEIGTGEFIIIDENEKIGHGIYSKTVIPERVVDIETNSAYFDCPGFSDTRNAAFDIASTYFIKKTLDFGKFVKLIFTVSYPSVRIGVDRMDFMKLVRHITEFIKHIEKYKNSIALVITKVDNEYVKRNRKLTLVSDKEVIDKIASYINSVRQSLKESLNVSNNAQDKIFYRNAITVLDIFLKKKNSTYLNIVLFRRPDETGILSNIELLQDGKKNIKELIEKNIAYSKKGEYDFGFTISDNTKINIAKLVNKINSEIANNIYNSKENIKKSYESKLMESTDMHELERDMEIMLKELLKTMKKLENSLSLKDYLVIFINFLNSKDVQNSRYFYLDVLKKYKYMQFLQLVSNEHFTIKALEFTKPIHEIVEYVSDSKNWYSFLVDLYHKLSVYNNYQHFHLNIENVLPSRFSKRRKRNANLINTDKLFSILQDYNINEMNKVQYKSIDNMKINDLNHVLNIIIKNTSSIKCENFDTLEIKGDFIKFSDIPLDNPCKHEIRTLKIFALNSIFIDTDLIRVGKKLKVFMIAPKWEVVGVKKIVLDGVLGESYSETKAAMGEDGKPGLPGGSAGNFFGVAIDIVNSELLTISANGGRGGAGQDGGEGYPGHDGVLHIPHGDYESGKQVMARNGYTYQSYDYSKTAENFFEVIGYIIGINHEKEKFGYVMKGETGSVGYDGARGGAGGVGGPGGKIYIHVMGHKVKVITSNSSGEEGVPGRGGNGGLGGKNADELWVQYNQKSSYWFRKKLRSIDRGWNVVKRIPQGIAKQGRISILTTREGIKSPESAIIMGNPSHCLNMYKSYLLENLFDYVKKNNLVKFYNFLNEDTSLKNYYDSFALLDEFFIFEKKNFKININENLEKFYKSLLMRINEYSTNPKRYESTQAHKTLLNYLYASVFSKILSLKNKNDGVLIINIHAYFDLILENIRNVRSNANKWLINEYNYKYKKQIDFKINEAKTLVEKHINHDIDNLASEFDKKIEMLVIETSKLKLTAGTELDELIHQQRQLFNEIYYRNIVENLKFLKVILNYLGPIGEIISNAISAKNTGINFPFALKDINIHDINSRTIPRGVHGLIDEGIIFVENFLHKKIAAFGNYLETLLHEFGKYPDTLGDVSNSVEEVRSNLTNDKQELSFPKITSLMKLIDNIIVSKVKDLSENTTDISDEHYNLPEINLLTTMKTLGQIAEIFTDVYLQNKENNFKLRQISEAIQQQTYNIEALGLYLQKIYDVVVPLIHGIKKDILKYEKELPLNSRSELDISKWKIKSTFKDVKRMFREITSGFQMEDELISLIDKIDEVLSALVAIYDKINYYGEQKEFSDYIADITTPAFVNSLTHNKTIDNALNKLVMNIKSSIIVDQYKNAIDGLKQFVFPFAEDYYSEFIFSENTQVKGDLESLAANAANQIEKIKTKLTESKLTLNKNIDQFIREEYFQSSNKFSSPFIVWDKYKYNHITSRLLSGEEVIIQADILKSMPNKDAIKFNKIELSIKTSDKTLVDKLKYRLMYFDVTMKHFGNSYFRCENNFYVLTSESQKFYYSFEKSSNGEPLRRNTVYTKITNGQYMLSPYATWSFQLNSANNSSFAQLNEFKGKIDLELIGHGQYISDNSTVCNQNLKKYYKTADTISVTEVFDAVDVI